MLRCGSFCCAKTKSRAYCRYFAGFARTRNSIATSLSSVARIARGDTLDELVIQCLLFKMTALSESQYTGTGEEPDDTNRIVSNLCACIRYRYDAARGGTATLWSHRIRLYH
jgi:hypothetical protein